MTYKVLHNESGVVLRNVPPTSVTHASGWTVELFEDEVEAIQRTHELNPSYFKEFDSIASYRKGDYVLFKGTLLRLKEQFTPEIPDDEPVVYDLDPEPEPLSPLEQTDLFQNLTNLA